MVVDPFWGGGKEEAQQKNELYGEEWSVGGNGGGVVIDNSRCGEVVHGGTVLGAWLNRS
jgi:hypothetical protein